MCSVRRRAVAKRPGPSEISFPTVFLFPPLSVLIIGVFSAIGASTGFVKARVKSDFRVTPVWKVLAVSSCPILRNKPKFQVKGFTIELWS